MNPRIEEIVKPHLERAEIVKAEIRAKAEENREKMPTLTPFINSIRKAFPRDVAYIRAEENGHTVEWGKPQWKRS